MPSSATITSSDFFSFVAKTRAKASQVNTNFSMFRGHLIPFDPNTIAAADATYDLGASDHRWNKLHVANFPMGSRGSEYLKPGPNDLAVTFPTITTARIVKGDGSNLSATSFGHFVVEDTTGATTSAGHLIFTLTANVDLTLGAGPHWGNANLGDLSATILDIVGIADSGTLKWAWSFLPGGFHEYFQAHVGSSSNTPANITVPNMLFIQSGESLTTSNLPVQSGWHVTASFDDTGGGSDNLWSIHQTQGGVRVGPSDGKWRPWAPHFTGFSSTPTGFSEFTLIKNTAFLSHRRISHGASNSTSFDIGNVPVNSDKGQNASAAGFYNGGGAGTHSGYLIITTTGRSIECRRNRATPSWTSSGNKSIDFSISYECRRAN